MNDFIFYPWEQVSYDYYLNCVDGLKYIRIFESMNGNYIVLYSMEMLDSISYKCYSADLDYLDTYFNSVQEAKHAVENFISKIGGKIINKEMRVYV